MTPDQVAGEFARLPGIVNDDLPLVRRGRFFSDRFMVQVDATPLYVAVREGRIEAVDRGPAIMRSWRFAIRAGAEAWQRFWEPVPRPGYHDLLAMTRFGWAEIDGDLQPLLANLRYVKEVLEAPRRHRREG